MGMRDPATGRPDDEQGGVAGVWGIVLTIVVTVVGATWYLGSTMATEDDITALRREMREEIRGVGDRLEAQMEEIRGYLVDHFDGHPTND